MYKYILKNRRGGNWAVSMLLAFLLGACTTAIRISPENPASLEVGIKAAYQSGKRKIVIPPGTYRLAELAMQDAYLNFKDMSDFEIDASGVTLLRTDPLKIAIQFNNCRNVTLRGATLLNETPPFTQGVIEAIDPNGDWYDVQIDKGYPADFDSPNTAFTKLRATVVVPNTRRFKDATKDCFFSRTERIGLDTFRFFFRDGSKLDPATHPAAVGDWLNFRGKVIRDIIVSGCEAMVIDEVTFMSGSGFCILEEGGEGGNRYTYKVTYGPKPAGADKEPLLASNADAFHSRNVRKGPVLENCFFEGMHDDGVPIHGTFAMVAESTGRKVIIGGGNFMRVGDPLCFYDPDGSYVDEAKIESIKPLPEYELKATVTNANQSRKRQFFEVTIDKEIELGFQYVVSDPAANGAGYVIRNCTIRNHRARGLLLKSDDGLVEGNTIESSTIAGIVIAPEIWWNEAGYSRNIVIRNNIIRHTGYSTAESSDHQSGAITICGAAGEPDQIVPVYQEPKIAAVKPGHHNIIIENNTIENCNGVNLLLGMAENVTVKNNQFIHSQHKKSVRGVPSGVDPSSLVWIYNCENVLFEGNTVTDRGHFGNKLVEINSNSKEITGLENGIILSNE